jgi:hypothetical protein
MIHIAAETNFDVCLDYIDDKKTVVGLNVRTADGRVFVRMADPKALRDTLTNAIQKCEETI